MKKHMILLGVCLILYVVALDAVMLLPPDYKPLLSKEVEVERLTINVSGHSMVSEVPYHLLEDNEVEIEVDYATPGQAIEEQKHAIEDRRPKRTYFGTMQLTAYVATGNRCADGVYPSSGYTVACNDSRLWHKTIYIEGYGTRYVHDRGGMPMNVLDLFVGSLSEAYQVGRRNVEVYIVE